MIRLRIEDSIVLVDSRFRKVSELLMTLEEQSLGTEIYDLSSNYITHSVFQIISKYYEYHQFAPPIIQRPSDNPDILFLNSHDRDLIMPFNPLDDDRLQKLIQASIYLGIAAFRKLCVARLLLEFYFDRNNPQVSAQRLKEKFPEVPNITMKDIEKYKKLYPQLSEEFK